MNENIELAEQIAEERANNREGVIDALRVRKSSTIGDKLQAAIYDCQSDVCSTSHKVFYAKDNLLL